MRRTRLTLLCAMGLLASCGSPNNQFPPDTGDMTVAPDQTMVAATVPDPGSRSSIGSLFLDPGEPNETPGTASPVGSWEPDNLGTFLLWITSNTFTTTDQADYYVFKTVDAGTLQLGSTGVCGAANVISKIDIWKVVGNQQVTPELKEFTSSGSCVPGTVALEASTTYLLGFFGGGTAGSYSA